MGVVLQGGPDARNARVHVAPARECGQLSSAASDGRRPASGTESSLPNELDTLILSAVGTLSNFLRRADVPTPAPAVYRPATQAEIHPALRLILGSGGRPAAEGAVIDFLQLTLHRGIDLNNLWVADLAGRVAWAVLPIVSPGRTMMLLAPGGRPRNSTHVLAGELVEAVCIHFRSRDVALAQVLLDPLDAAARASYLERSFRPMAELVYLQVDVRRSYPASPLPAGFEWVLYSPAEHAAFAATIVESYRDSLDCPGLNGVRDVEDVIAGHKSSGEFDPTLWFLLREQGQPRAVLLLSRTAQAGTAELVYLGLTPAARGRGLGDVLMRQALHSVASQGPGTLALAVDAGNVPALRLYHRHGLRRVGSKLALMRQLSPDTRHAQPTPRRTAEG